MDVGSTPMDFNEDELMSYALSLAEQDWNENGTVSYNSFLQFYSLFQLPTCFEGEFGYSKRKKHPILIYRSRRDPSKCLTFLRRHEARYTCIQCVRAHKGDSASNNNVSISVDGSRFLSDPEELKHSCLLNGMIQSYTGVIAKQCYR
jgi:hypothetical protein